MNTLLVKERSAHAIAIQKAGGLQSAIEKGLLNHNMDTTLCEAILWGLLRQNVSTFFTVLGHGSTELGEVLRIYHDAGLVKVFDVQNEIEASHAATALRWVTGEKAAVLTSIGPGAMHALAASLVPASDGIGVWYIFGDETTEDEGFNMQQIPKPEQDLFLRMMSTMGSSYTLHTPGALATALHRGMVATAHPYRAGPFYLLLPMNVQPASLLNFNLDELPCNELPRLGAAEGNYEQAVDWILDSQRIIVKIGGGGKHATSQIARLLELSEAVAVWTPIATGVIPYANPHNMLVGGSKGTLCGNFAMEQADLLIAIGTRAVCQSDCSRTGYPNVRHVININADYDSAAHYHHSLALVGDASSTLQILIEKVDQRSRKTSKKSSSWLAECQQIRMEWETFKTQRYESPSLRDEFWAKDVLTQPAVIKTATDWARANDVVTFFDAGDVQANGFQIVEDEHVGQTIIESGASYMGFAVSALLASAASEKPFYGLAITGDGSFLMNPQVLVDGSEFGARGCILLLDNNRMGAISGLQKAQYGVDFATSHKQTIDYLSWAAGVKNVLALECKPSPAGLMEALHKAHTHKGLSLVYVPVYYGDNELGGMGVYGRWNVGNWTEETQSLRHKIGL